MNLSLFISILTGVGWPSRHYSEPIETIGFTSCGEGHGISTVAGNVAAAVACSGQQTLLVDCDFSRPTLHDAFDLMLAPGLADLIGNRQETEPQIQETAVPNLRLLSAGNCHLKPKWNIDSIGGFFRSIMTETDLVICDIPALGAQKHSASALKMMDRVIVVIDSSRTTSKQLADYRQRMSRLGISISGIVMNRPQSDYEYHYDYDYEDGVV